MKKTYFLAGFIVLAILIPLVIVGIRFGSNNNGNTTTETISNYDKIVEDSGEFTISIVNAYEFKDCEKYGAPDKGYAYYCVEIVAENITKGSKGVYRSEFTCTADGEKAEQMVFNESDFAWGDVLPGEKTTGKLYFKVPKGSKDIKVEYKNNSFEENTGVFFDVK